MNPIPTGWKLENQKLCKVFVCRDFASAFAFITMVAMDAEKHDHHPDFSMSYKTIRFELCSHDTAFTATKRDYQLAERIEVIFNQFIS